MASLFFLFPDLWLADTGINGTTEEGKGGKGEGGVRWISAWGSLVQHPILLIRNCNSSSCSHGGLWDVMSSQCAVTIARKALMIHNDPERCSRELVREALKRNTCDNLTVVVVCFSPDPPQRIEVRVQSRVRRSISADGLNLLKGVLDGYP